MAPVYIRVALCNEISSDDPKGLENLQCRFLLTTKLPSGMTSLVAAHLHFMALTFSPGVTVRKQLESLGATFSTSELLVSI